MPNRSKFYQLPPATPWPSLSTAFYMGVGDVDGDGRQEIIALNHQHDNTFFCTLSHIKRGELNPLWDTKDWGQLVIMDTQINSLGQWTFSSTDHFVMADVDGDGADEILAFNAAGRAAIFDWAVEGSGGTAQLAVSNTWLQQSAVNGPAGTWTFSGKESFFAADIDADGSQELIVFDSGQRLGVLKWTGSALSLTSLSNAAVQAGSGAMPWYLFPSDTFYRVHIGQRDCVAAFDGHSWLGLFNWTGAALQVEWSTDAPIGTAGQPQWQMKPGDQLHVADLDGDGDQEIFLYNGTSVAVAKWQSPSVVLAVPPVSEFNNGFFQWSVTPGQRFFVLKLPNIEIIAGFNGEELGTFGWQDGQLQIGVTVNGLANPPGQWAFSPEDHIFPADLDGDHHAELFIADNAGRAAVLEYGVVAIWNVADKLSSWNLDFVMAAPPVPLAPFPGTQLPVYQYMSNNVYPESLGDIRSEYLNTNVGGFDTYASTLQGMSNPPGQGFTDADWAAVQSVLVPELRSVCPTRTLFQNLDALALDAKSQQDADLSHAITMVNEKIVTDNSSVDYVLGQIVEAIFWGAAAAPEEKGAQIALAMLASLFGGELGSYGPPQTATYSDFKSMVDNQFLNATKKNDDNSTTAMTDAGLLAVIGQLASQGWKWDPNQSITIAQLSQNANRVAFYQVTIPVRYQVVEFLDNEMNYPYGDAQNEAPWSYWAVPAERGLFNVYMLGYPDTFFHPYGFPSQDLMTDLFDNLGVPREEFFLGAYGWNSIKHVSSTSDKAALTAVHQ